MKKVMQLKGITIVSIILLFAFFSSCNKILDVNADDYVITADGYYSTEEQLETALRGVYATLAESGLYANYMIGRMALDADEGYFNYATDLGTIGYNSISTSDVKILAYWQKLYAGINRANFLLANVDNTSIDITDSVRNVIKGSALFLRGYYYYMLVTKFGGVPLVLAPTESGDAENVQVARASAKEVYEQIVTDMETAADMVPSAEQVQYGGYVSQSAIWGILARVCLHEAGSPVNETSRYADAATYAQKVINTGMHELDTSYQQIFVNYAQDLYDIKESIWEVEFYGNNTGVYTATAGMVGRNNGIKYTGTAADFGYSIGVIYTTQWLYDLYDEDDIRRDWAIAPYRYVADTIQYFSSSTNVLQRNAGKFRREYETLLPKSTAATPQNFPLLRYSDVLLMYAEAENEVNSGPTDEAYEAINQVRRRAMGVDIYTSNSSVDLSSMSYATFKAEIKDERARELCFEDLRRDDLIRWGDYYTNMKVRLLEVSSTSTTTYLTYFLQYFGNVGIRDVLWPIPSYELGVNAKLVQNDGW
ncbi:MAG: RagB/SusD family nutrient uptake outer membrane protein [Niabella sp.]